MSKQSYAAKFSDGSCITRKSDRDYSHAYRVTGDCSAKGAVIYGSGFAGSFELAQKAASACGFGQLWDGRKRKFVTTGAVPNRRVEVVIVEATA